jgi:hypothetical protein
MHASWTHPDTAFMPRLAMVCLAILPLLCACQLARMQVSSDLAAVQPFDVDRASWRSPNDPLRFGSWRTAHIDVGWGKFRSSNQAVTDRGKAVLDFESFQRPYRLDVESSGGVISAECVERAEAVAYKDWSLDSGALKGIPPLHCSYYGAAKGEMELLEMPTLAESEAGNIEFDATRWHLQSVNRIEGGRGPGDIVGYEIRRGSEVIAAVETMNKGRVWMSPALTPLERDCVATVAMALLVYESPQEAMERIRDTTDED